MVIKQEQWAEFGRAVFEKLSLEASDFGSGEIHSDVLMAIAEDYGIVGPADAGWDARRSLEQGLKQGLEQGKDRSGR